MRDIYVKTSVSVGSIGVRTDVSTPGYHSRGKLAGFSICRILDVPESVSDHLAVFTFNSCAVLGHTVRWDHLHKGQPVRGEGLAWEPADLDPVVL